MRIRWPERRPYCAVHADVRRPGGFKWAIKVDYGQIMDLREVSYEIGASFGDIN